jgi:hypothetical protein
MSWEQFPYMDKVEGIKKLRKEHVNGKGFWVFEPHMETWFYVNPEAPEFKSKLRNEANNLMNAFMNKKTTKKL